MLVLIGITAFYFSNTTESVENAYQREGEIHEDIVGKTVRIKDLYNKTVIVKNTGTRNISLSDIKIYVDNSEIICSWNESNIKIGSTIKCILPENCYNNQILRVTAPGNFDAYVCEFYTPFFSKRFNATEDTYIQGDGLLADIENKNFGASPALYIGKRNMYEKYKSMLRFGQIALPENANITEALLAVYVVGEEGPGDINYSVYRLLQNWGEGNKNNENATYGEANWIYFKFDCTTCVNGGYWLIEGAGSASDTENEDGGADRRMTPISSAVITGINTTVYWNITKAVLNWTSGSWNINYGLIIIPKDENAKSTQKWFGSSESAQKPYIEVRYTLNNPV
jgi:hypothetical protein